ncbi:group 1 truncated hemoglobin [Pseudomonas sp. CCI1.2]|uniref:group I truncated hemoglobin n=1 Tax=Pseudomonas sp. CCI1.2 TaxID=3048614 RepID=UPI002B228426|nr:group 1 truncated hemoglobin [Pseudomonas sp. CCI1.2]MEB0121737.1 group 1 truncated hemoglobin [Pseudomonas sp. CCI1.2]
MRLLPWMLIAVLAGCAQTPAHDDSLYLALGQRAGLQRIVEGMLLNIAKDPRIVEHFKRVDVVRLRDKLVEKFCVETGGPCRYSGDSMAEVHKGQHLTRSDFNALVEDLIDAMDSQHIPVPTQNGLIAKLAPLRGEVIEK